MMYIKWLVYFIISIPIQLSGYCLMNFIVPLFADENGELKGFLKLYQQYDDSLYSDDVVHKKQLPNIFLYDWDKHYALRHDWSDKKLAEVGQDRWWSDCINNNFTIKEKIQRYICAVYWCMRNCCYGFSFWWLGANIIPKDVVKHSEHFYTYGNKYFKYTNSNIFWRCGSYYAEWNIYFGWKFKENDSDKITRCQFAERIFAFKVRKTETETI